MEFPREEPRFYKPKLSTWGHCKKLAPEWKKAAKNLQGKVKLGHVNYDDEKSLMSRFKVQGFPTILIKRVQSFALVQLETNVAPPEVIKLTSSVSFSNPFYNFSGFPFLPLDVMEEKCGSAAICFVSFLPDILDSKAEGRNKYIEILLAVVEKFKRSPYKLYRFLLLLAGQSSSGFIFDVGGKEGILAVELIPSDGGDA
uniref:Thioredoxin domain-containing protein n=1 Tax=Lactuca sativa TaxID=4236 RepID=A0A9R1VLG7_LACSA|nr:hypothetical protein LSAT_V11C500255440 [Lactuca sativa]